MNFFTKLFFFQLLLYLIISPIFYILQNQDINNSLLILYILPFIFYYYFYFNKKKVHTSNLVISNNSRYYFPIIVILLLLYSIKNPFYGRLSIRELSELTAESGIINIILSKVILFVTPILFLYSIKYWKQNKILAAFYIVLIIFIIFFKSGFSQKGPLISAFILALALNEGFKGYKKKYIYLAISLFLLFFIISATWRYFDSEKNETFNGIISKRVNGLELVLQNRNEIIKPIYLANPVYFGSIFIQFLRFADEENSDLIKSSLNGPKAFYLLDLGEVEFDYNFSFVSEGILLFGYIFGVIISFAVILYVHNSSFNLLSSKSIIKYSLGYSLLFNSLMVERGLAEYLTSFIKTLPFAIIFIFLLFKIEKQTNVLND
jgi:hypothetical protein